MGAHSVGAALALAEVVVDVDRLLHIWTAFSDLLHHIHHQIQHVAPVLEGVLLAPLHILHTHTYFRDLGAVAEGKYHANLMLATHHVCKWLAATGELLCNSAPQSYEHQALIVCIL